MIVVIRRSIGGRIERFDVSGKAWLELKRA